MQHVREQFVCRECETFICRKCEKISQAPAQFHVLPRGFASPSRLAMILFEVWAASAARSAVLTLRAEGIDRAWLTRSAAAPQ